MKVTLDVVGQNGRVEQQVCKEALTLSFPKPLSITIPIPTPIPLPLYPYGTAGLDEGLDHAGHTWLGLGSGLRVESGLG